MFANEKYISWNDVKYEMILNVKLHFKNNCMDIIEG